MNKVLVAKHSYGRLKIVLFNCKSKLIIENFVSIANNVAFLLNADHFTTHIYQKEECRFIKQKGIRRVIRANC